MSKTYYEKKQLTASSLIRILMRIIIILSILTALFFAFFRVENVKILKISDQETNYEYFSTIVATSDILTYGWIHSLEHIPWTEEFIIREDNTLLLKKITITAFGAGIPHNKGKITKTEDGKIIMDEINELFDEINWVHSQTATDYIMLNNQIILKGNDLPHHRSLNLKIEKRLRICPKL